MPIRVVAFDMSKTYINVTKRVFYNELGRYFGVPSEKIRTRYHSTLEQLQTGRESENEFWTRFANGYGKEPDMNLIRGAIRALYHGTKVMPGLDRLVRRLKRKYKVGMISNTDRYSYEVIKSHGWYRPFKPVVLSFKVGCSKPHKNVFRHFIRKSGAKPEEIVFIDNKMENVRGARRAGMKAIHFRSARQTERELRKMGVEI
ncbi:MAG: HAD-IA family hydrolase [Candidatus Aenigmatarchaeota archaeon]